jgi:NAD-dependent dihydropyrimidine dehydrogenase PreA subunit
MDLILPVIDCKKCTLCGICIDECKTHALAIHKEQLIIAKPDSCNYCADCEGSCPQGAIRVEYEFYW